MTLTVMQKGKTEDDKQPIKVVSSMTTTYTSEGFTDSRVIAVINVQEFHYNENLKISIMKNLKTESWSNGVSNLSDVTTFTYSADKIVAANVFRYKFEDSSHESSETKSYDLNSKGYVLLDESYTWSYSEDGDYVSTEKFIETVWKKYDTDYKWSDGNLTKITTLGARLDIKYEFRYNTDITYTTYKHKPNLNFIKCDENFSYYSRAFYNYMPFFGNTSKNLIDKIVEEFTVDYGDNPNSNQSGGKYVSSIR